MFRYKLVQGIMLHFIMEYRKTLSGFWLQALHQQAYLFSHVSIDTLISVLDRIKTLLDIASYFISISIFISSGQPQRRVIKPNSHDRLSALGSQLHCFHYTVSLQDCLFCSLKPCKSWRFGDTFHHEPFRFSLYQEFIFLPVSVWWLGLSTRLYHNLH